MLVLDSGGVTRLAERSRTTAALILALREENLWPPLVPSIHGIDYDCHASYRFREG